MRIKDTWISLSLLASALTLGLAIGWVTGSAWPWTLIPIIIGLALGMAWLVWTNVQLNREMDEWAIHAETARRLLDEAEGDDDA